MHTSCNTALQLHMLHFIDLVMIGPLNMAYPSGCQHTTFILSRLRPYPMRGHELLFVCCILSPVSNQRLVQVDMMLWAAASEGPHHDR